MWVWLLFIGVIGTLGQIVVTDALKLADMTVLMPLDFLKLVWATAFGILLFAEVPDLLTFVGAAIVFGSSFYIAWREAKLRKAAKAQASDRPSLAHQGLSVKARAPSRAPHWRSCLGRLRRLLAAELALDLGLPPGHLRPRTRRPPSRGARPGRSRARCGSRAWR